MSYDAFPVALALVSGIAAHWSVWIRGEWDGHIVEVVLSFIGFHALATISQIVLLGRNLSLASSYTTALISLHLLGLTYSILTYRIFYHPLRRIPGPFFAKVWIWWRAFSTWRSGMRQSVMLQGIHRQHGDVVRIGPNQLSINMPSSVALIHGSGSTYRTAKSAGYLNPANPGSVNAHRDPHKHMPHRRKWDRALSPRAATSYVPAINAQISVLLSRLRAYQGRAMTANLELHLFAFDVMGSIGFGRPEGFNQMGSGKLHPAIRDLVAMMSTGVYMMMIPWLHVFSAPFPASGLVYKPDEEFRVFAKGVLKEKSETMLEKSKDAAPTDVISYLMRTQTRNDIALTESQLISDALILSIAGSDNPTSACVHMVYRLARHPDVQQRLLGELRAAGVSKDASVEWSRIAKLPYLEAFINETLRLHPPAPSALNRTVPPEGFTLEDGTYIPGGTDVINPVYTMQRDERFFVFATDFIPERWLTPQMVRDSEVNITARPDLLLDRRAFIPFLTGPYGCAGKFVAYMELKLVLATICRTFVVTMPENADIVEVDRRINEEWLDYTTTQPARVDVRFIERPV